ncbi:amidohydrolase family protein [Pseudopelagicola sp. nBUS_19]|uniref:amidohydrolase family protein n=1 Tax=unclassified Pseudopelagicola TaxID=2649563 RepID=UPI003EBA0880
MNRRIDSHQHFWNPCRGDYDWMPMDNAILARRYGPTDIEPHLNEHGIDQTVLVQAAATLEETEYMLGIADASARVAGVVGWINFEDRSHARHLRRLANHPKFLGVRPMIQDIPDSDWMLRDDVKWAYDLIIECDLTFDALGYPKHLDNFLKLLTRFPDLRVVIDHGMKPQIRSHSKERLAHWAAGMTRLAEKTTAFCKFSGLVTETDGWSLDALRPYADHLLHAFGPERMMWGSDWPVCRLEASYNVWYDTARSLMSHVSDDAQDLIFGGTASTFYRL